MANKQIEGHQCTILWHVDDLKLSHVSYRVLDEVITGLNDCYGKIALLTVTRGKVHDYLGMTIDYSIPGKVIIHMDDYVKAILNEAVNHLFDVNPDAESLDMAQAELFHHLMAKLLFLCKWAHPDIQTPVAFMTTRVRGPNTNDYKKLTQMI